MYTYTEQTKKSSGRICGSRVYITSAGQSPQMFFFKEVYMNYSDSKQIATRVSINTIIVNIILTIFKIIAGITASSAAMISDAIHSASDILSTIVVIVGVKMASKTSDADHQYGHERLECVSAIILAGMLGITGVGIGISGIGKVISRSAVTVPGILALIAAIVSIVIKEGMYHYTKRAAVKINSGALLADAWHHRSDALSSIGSFAGILGARLAFPVLDPIASIVICLFIIKAAADIFLDAVNKMTDKACDAKTVSHIRELILECSGVLGIDDLKTRKFGDKIYVDVEIIADGTITLAHAHDIAEMVHMKIEKEIENVKHCMVHINPS